GRFDGMAVAESARMKRIVMGLGAILCIGVIAGACGGTTAFACGTVTCSGDEICLHPCCGGAPPQCEAADDAGTCPQGTTETTSCSNYSATNKCLPAPCTPPPPYCAPKANTCQGYLQDSENCFQGCA